MTTCVEQLTCLPEKPLDILKFYNYQYGIPDAVTLGIFLGILIAAITLWTRSFNIMAILGIYAVSIIGATWASESTIQPIYSSMIWIIAIAIASLAVIAFLKVTRE